MRLALVVGFVLAVWLLHRLALWLEARGWLYYRHTRPTRSALGSAFLEVQQLVDPGKRLVLQATREDRTERAESGDPPSEDTEPSRPDVQASSTKGPADSSCDRLRVAEGCEPNGRIQSMRRGVSE